jgi:hypothetical protein
MKIIFSRKGWRGVFVQDDSSQSHLINEKVWDLFLIYKRQLKMPSI